jgi:putative MATE family efflux protein
LKYDRLEKSSSLQRSILSGPVGGPRRNFLLDPPERARRIRKGRDIVKDLTQGSILRQMVFLSVPIAAGMVFQTLYFLVDLYFVSGLGGAAIAGVGAAGTIPFVVLALTQVLGVGTVALVAQAAGRKDQPEANLVFNQSVVLSALCGVMTLLGAYLFSAWYMRSVAADAASASAGATYLYWYAPGLALQFAQVAMGSALRGTGIVQPGMIVQILTVILNIVFAPVLIAGWGTHWPLGVAGAGLASTLAIACGVVFLWVYFEKLEHFVALRPAEWRPHGQTVKRILSVGLPAGGEFLMMCVIMVVIYWTIRHFGSAPQAGFGIAYRVMQAFFLPVLAIAFAAAPLAGQNFGARQADRVKQTFYVAAGLSSVLMVVVTLVCQWRPEAFVRFFSEDADVVAAGALYMRIVSWNAVAAGLAFCCSSLFQGMGNTWPALLSSMSRLLTFALPAVLLVSWQPHFELRHLWYLSVFSTALQALASLALLQRELRRRLPSLEIPQAEPAAAVQRDLA